MPECWLVVVKRGVAVRIKTAHGNRISLAQVTSFPVEAWPVRSVWQTR